MNERIALVLKTKNITPTQLADDLGVQRSGISHILNGRNKPSLDFIQKIIKKYPDISMTWLMFGEGPMMNPYPGKGENNSSPKTINPMASLIDLFEVNSEEEMIQPNLGGVKDDESKFKPQSFRRVSMPYNHTVGNTQKNFEEIIQKNVQSINEEDASSQSMNQENASSQNTNVENSSSNKVHEAESIGMETNIKSFKSKSNRVISRIIIFYNDKSFVEYTPGTE